ncbi:MAG: adenylyltransferase/cytidyltransferase family protein [Oligoflexia bacterium]|nr:adenylyltransferase/cytidyltransferase family protein [Oligoflexia bacterium]
MTKFIDCKNLSEIVENKKAQGLKVGLAHGCFDFIHLGHIRHFKSAKSLCDFLIVSLTADEFISKGENRPFYKQDERVEFLENLEMIDVITINPDKTSIELLKMLKPNIYIKGQDYKDFSKDPTGMIELEAQAIKSVGGTIEFTDDEKMSSTKILKDFGLS